MSLIIEYALRFVGRPYYYGGTTPMQGFDCSGLVMEILEAAGVLQYTPPSVKYNAQALYHFFSAKGSVGAYGPGSLAFYGKDLGHIDHVAFCLDDRLMLEAGGGHADTQDINHAIQERAFVRMRPIKYRTDFLCVIKPFYPGML